MKYQASRGFEKILQKLHPNEKIEVQRNIDALARALDARAIPHGIGLKKLGNALWEFRISISLRVLLVWKKEAITFLFVGNHNEVQQFLKYYLS